MDRALLLRALVPQPQRRVARRREVARHQRTARVRARRLEWRRPRRRHLRRPARRLRRRAAVAHQHLRHALLRRLRAAAARRQQSGAATPQGGRRRVRGGRWRRRRLLGRAEGRAERGVPLGDQSLPRRRVARPRSHQRRRLRHAAFLGRVCGGKDGRHKRAAGGGGAGGEATEGGRPRALPVAVHGFCRRRSLSGLAAVDGGDARSRRGTRRRVVFRSPSHTECLRSPATRWTCTALACSRPCGTTTSCLCSRPSSTRDSSARLRCVATALSESARER